MKVRDIVKYARPEAGEKGFRFIVREVNGDRAMCELICGMAIKPVECLPVEAVEVVKVVIEVGAKVKEIGWAYPSSDDAKKFGYAARGCYVLNVGVWGEPLVAVLGDSNVSGLILQGEAREGTWTPYSLV